ncbi:MAG: LysR family transcriptional regulator [Acidobacteriales bacterium]|nr:LysR family transcriptional regulator [Terriglobales bacterium]
MPTSTLSRRISALERELGFNLIHRSTRIFKLTDAGQACYEQSKALLPKPSNPMDMIGTEPMTSSMPWNFGSIVY